MKVPVYNQAGGADGSVELNEAVFGVKPKASLIHQVYVALSANARQPWAHTKDKGDVRGGGRKPWKQKGTGRARHGSIRSPLWRGGGITFGPLNIRNYKQKINKKMNQQAVRMCLSDKVSDHKLVVVESLPADGRTKTLVALRQVLPGSGKRTMVLTEDNNELVRRASRNLAALDWQCAAGVNVVDLMHHQYVIITKSGIKILENRLE